MESLTIRKIEVNEENLLSKFLKKDNLFSLNPSDYFLAAFNNDEIVGVLQGKFINKELFTIKEITVNNDNTNKLFSDHLYNYFSKEKIEINSNNKQKFNYYLEESGFIISKQKIFVEKNLENYLFPYENIFTYKSLVQTGKDYFIQVMTEASTGDPFENMENRDPDEDFQELIDYAGNKYNPENWKIAFLENEIIGVILPQAFADRKNEGSIFYLGVVPDFRGKGFGKILHSKALIDLKEIGIDHYKGSTDSRNKPMIKIFQENQCLQSGLQIIYSV